MKKYFISNFIVFILSIVLFSACGKDEKSKVYLTKNEETNLSDNTDDKTEENSVSKLENESEIESGTNEIIYVQVTGAVNSPGVYKVEVGLRVFEVLEVAGGATDNADTEAINMARPVKDEMIIHVPTKEEVLQGFSEETGYEYEDYRLEDESTTYRMININTATASELMELPGIGEAKANLIISYREENGSFKNIEDIMNITGIKQSAFDKIKDMIEV